MELFCLLKLIPFISCVYFLQLLTELVSVLLHSDTLLARHCCQCSGVASLQ